MDLFKLLGIISISNSDAKKALEETSESGKKAESKLGKTFKAIGNGAVVVGKTVAAGMAVGATAVGEIIMHADNYVACLDVVRYVKLHRIFACLRTAGKHVRAGERFISAVGHNEALELCKSLAVSLVGDAGETECFKSDAIKVCIEAV